MNYYLPIHQALVNKSNSTHVYWYVTFALIFVLTCITSYMALTDVDHSMFIAADREMDAEVVM